MKKLLLITGCFLLFTSGFSFAQSWDWGKQGKVIGMKPVVTCYVTTDVAGNAFITGKFTPSIAFGTDTLVDSTIGVIYDTYFAKYNSIGTLQWTQQFITTYGNLNYPGGITMDASNNEIIAGVFDGALSIGSFNITTYDQDVFLAKFDNNGNALWAIAENVDSNTGYATPTAVITDKFKNIYITGSFSGTIKFGNTTFFGSDTTNEIFTAKYDSNGNILWAKQGIKLSPPEFNEIYMSNAVAVDLNGNSIITGSYNDSIIFGLDTLVSPIVFNNQKGSEFIVKYDPNGNLIWARQSVIHSANSSAIGFGVTIDNAENIYLTGTFSDTVSFGAYSLTQTSPSRQAIFLVKYNPNGNVIWAKSGVAFYYQPVSLLSDDNNNIYMSGGGPGDSITFGAYTLHSSSPNGENSFMIKFDTSGDAICGSMLKNGMSNNFDNYSATDRSGTYVYEVGVFLNDTIFCSLDTLIAYGQDPYVARWQNCGLEDAVPIINSTTSSIILYPNPSTGIFNIALVGTQNFVPSTVEVYNVLGEKVYSNSYKLSANSYQLDLSSQPNGIYLYRVLNADGNLLGEGKLVIQK